MSTIFMDGFDSYSAIADILYGAWQNYSGMSIDTSGGRYGGGKMQGGNAWATANIPETSELYVGFALYINASSTTYAQVVRFDSASGHEATVYLKPSDGTWYLTRATSPDLTTGTHTVTVGTWYWVEVRYIPNNAGGVFTLWVDGTQVATFTGDTRATGGSGGIVIVEIGARSSVSNWHYDDIYVNDTAGSAPANGRLGDSRIRTFVPNADTTPNDGTPSTGSDHYAVMDEAQRNTSDYNTLAAPSPGDSEIFGSDAALASNDEVVAVRAMVYCAKSDAGTATGKAVIKQGSDKLSGSDTALATSGTDVQGIFNVDPTSATQFTHTDVNSLDFGYEVVA